MALAVLLAAACARGEHEERAIRSEPVTIAMGTRSFGGTITRPDKGSGPGILLIAGSGPTDRDWNSPLMPGTNGSGKLIAEELARRGMVVLRYDKTTSGKNALPADMTYDLFRDEARAALALLRARPEVDRAHLYVAGHSEGGVQALRVAQAEPAGSLAGVILLSSPGRRIADVMVGQLESQLLEAANRRMMSREVADKAMADIRQAFADFTAGADVDPRKVTSLQPVQQLLVPIMSARAAPVGRAWVTFDPAQAAAGLDLPVLILNGDKDVQVDPELDARRLEKARKAAGKPVDLVIVKDANHVYKAEARSLAEIRANLAVTTSAIYNQEDIPLASGLIGAIADWVARH